MTLIITPKASSKVSSQWDIVQLCWGLELYRCFCFIENIGIFSFHASHPPTHTPALIITFQGARYGKDSQYTPRNLMMPASFLMERPAHLALGFRGEDLFMSGRPGVRDSLLWPVIHALIYLFLPDPLSFWSHPLSSVIFPNYFPCGSFLFHSTWPPPTLSIIVFFLGVLPQL